MPITPTMIANAERDMADLGLIVNGDDTTSVPTRYGGVVPTLRKFLADALTGLADLHSYRFGGSIETALGVNDIIFRHVLQNAVTFADDFAGSIGRRGPGVDPPGVDQVLPILKNGVGVGSVTVDSDGTVHWATTAGALACAAGDEIRLQMPAASPAAELVGASFTLLGVEG